MYKLLRVKVFKQRKFAARSQKALHYQFKLKQVFFSIAATEIEVKEIKRTCDGHNQKLWGMGLAHSVRKKMCQTLHTMVRKKRNRLWWMEHYDGKEIELWDGRGKLLFETHRILRRTHLIMMTNKWRQWQKCHFYSRKHLRTDWRGALCQAVKVIDATHLAGSQHKLLQVCHSTAGNC